MWSQLLKLALTPVYWHYVHMPGKSYAGKFEPLTEAEQDIREHIEWYVRKLAEEIGGRNIGQYESLQKAARYIETTFWGMGYETQVQEFTVRQAPMKNIVAEIEGDIYPNQIIVIGAHYDTVFGSPGADDNATGVAAMLELARILRRYKLAHTVRFVAFANEEHVNQPRSYMGSYAYARQCRLRGENIIGMISLEMLGYYSAEPGSQKYPFPLNLFYPQVGNFVGFVGDDQSRSWIIDVVRAFRAHAKFPSQAIAAPGNFPDANRSDHWSFWHHGYSGLMVTDTSNFRYPFVHTKEDTPDKLDFVRMTRVVSGLAAALVELANRA